MEKEQRLANFSNEVKAGRIGNNRFDIMFLQELWLKPDHDIISSNLPDGYHMTSFQELNDHRCIGYLMYKCSGLAIISRYPLTNIAFNLYNNNIWFGRGFGKATIRPNTDVMVELFVTHCSLFQNAQEKQVAQLMKAIDASEADVIVLGGDLNSSPYENTISIIRQHQMKDSKEEALEKEKWRNPKYMTMANAKNKYRNHRFGLNRDPEILDYLFYRTNPKTRTTAKPKDYEVPLLNFSDHQPVMVTMVLGKCFP